MALRSPAVSTTVWPSLTVRLLFPRTGVSSTLALNVIVAAAGAVAVFPSVTDTS